MKTKSLAAVLSVSALLIAIGIWWWRDLPRPASWSGSSEIVHGESGGTKHGAPPNGERTVREPRTREESGLEPANVAHGGEGSDGLARRSAAGSTHSAGSTQQRPGVLREGQSGRAAFDVGLARQSLEQKLALYFQVADSDSATREKLLQIETAAQMEWDEISRLGRENGLSTRAIAQLRRESQQIHTQEIYDLLGQEAGQYFLDSRYATMFSPITDDFAARCAAAGVPVSPSVRNDIAINFSKNLRNPAILAGYPKLPDGSLLADRDAVQRASAVLNPAQLTIFKQILSERPYPKPGG